MECVTPVRAEQCGKALVVSFEKASLQGHQAEDLISRNLHDLALQSSIEELRLDFRGVHFISSGVLGKLVALDRQLRRHGRRLTLYNLCHRIQEVLAATRLNTFFRLGGADAAPALAPIGLHG